jgi:hypothetical protein
MTTSFLWPTRILIACRSQGEKTDDSSDDNEDKEESSAPAPSDEQTSEPAEGRKAEDIPESEISGKVAQASMKLAEVSLKSIRHTKIFRRLNDSDWFMPWCRRSPQSVNVPKAAMGNQTEDSSSNESSSSSSEEGGKMEAADEGRKAEDIPASEIENSLHQAEVSQESAWNAFEMETHSYRW